MRVPAAILTTVIALPLFGAAPLQVPDANSQVQVVTTVPTAAAPSRPDCPRTSSYLANGSGVFQGEPLQPRKLTELPPATGYMAVAREIDGCDAPMTMVEYRNGGRR